MANNNGSAFGGYAANTVFTNVVGGIIMILVRFHSSFGRHFPCRKSRKKENGGDGRGKTLSTCDLRFTGLFARDYFNNRRAYILARVGLWALSRIS